MGLKLIDQSGEQWGASLVRCSVVEDWTPPNIRGFFYHKRTTNMAAMMRGCRVLERAPFLVSLSLFRQLGWQSVWNLFFHNFEEECLKLKLYCSYGRLERSVFRQLVVLNSLPRLVLASFVVLLACLLPLNLDGTDKIYDAHFYRISVRLCKPQFVSIYWPLPWRTMTFIAKSFFLETISRTVSVPFASILSPVSWSWLAVNHISFHCINYSNKV